MSSKEAKYAVVCFGRRYISGEAPKERDEKELIFIGMSAIETHEDALEVARNGLKMPRVISAGIYELKEVLNLGVSIEAVKKEGE